MNTFGPPSIRVFMADDHPMFREGLRRILNDSEGIEVVGEAATVPELLDRLDSVRPDVVLLDVSLPGPGLFETLRILRERGLRTLVLSRHPESHYATRAIKGGASGYLTKEMPAHELIRALHRVHEGRTYVSAEEVETRVEKPAGESLHDRLSEREFQILLLLASGKTVGDISRELSLSPKTVSTYRSRLLGKLGLRSTADLVRYALENQLL